MLFIQLSLHLKPVQGKKRVNIAHAVYAHAAIMRAISTTDTALGQKLHDMKRYKPITLAFIENNLSLTFIGAESLSYMNALVSYLQQEPRLQIGKNFFEVTNIDVGKDGTSGVATWADICQKTQHRVLHFHFQTPTAITRQDDLGERYSLLYPTPNLIFENLIRRWVALGGNPLPAQLSDYLISGGCVIKKYNLKTVNFPVQKRSQFGFIGQATYMCRSQETSCVEALNNLTRLAPFVGIGYQTARGMGAVTTHLSK